MFTNPIIGGNNTLIRTSIQSPDYVAGVSGWSINKDGSAEFNDATVRGQLRVTDPDGTYVAIFDEVPGDGAIVEFGLPDTVANPKTPGRVYTTSNTPFFGVPGMVMQAPTVNGFAPPAYLALGADNVNNESIALLTADTLRVISAGPLYMFADGVLNLIGTTQVNVSNTNDFVVSSGTWAHFYDRLMAGPNDTEISRGWLAGAGITSSNAVVTNAEVVQLTAKDQNGNTPTYRAGRAYKVVVRGGVTTSNIVNAPLWRLKKTNTAGQQFDVWRTATNVAGQTYPVAYTTGFRCDPNNDVTADIVLTLTAPAGINMQLTGAGTSPAVMDIYDDGLGTGGFRSWLPTLV